MIKDVKILVVDDDAGIRNFVVNALTYCVNREVLPFRDGLAAWRYLENGGQADMIVSDVDMPEMDGFDLMAKAKRKREGIAVVLMSGKSSNEERAVRAGADGFLAKPFAINDLFAIVQTYIVD